MFNFEGGCYAKVIRLSAEAEPQIYATTRRFGTVLENVVLDPSDARLDLDDDRAHREHPRRLSDRATSPTPMPSGVGGHPTNIVFLTADAFGVLPPIARLTPEQAMYHFLSGYTAKVAGTEKRRDRAAGDLQRPASARRSCRCTRASTPSMLGERIAQHGRQVWLVNTGWTRRPVRRRASA